MDLFISISAIPIPEIPFINPGAAYSLADNRFWRKQHKNFISKFLYCCFILSSIYPGWSCPYSSRYFFIISKFPTIPWQRHNFSSVSVSKRHFAARATSTWTVLNIFSSFSGIHFSNWRRDNNIPGAPWHQAFMYPGLSPQRKSIQFPTSGTNSESSYSSNNRILSRYFLLAETEYRFAYAIKNPLFPWAIPARGLPVSEIAQPYPSDINRWDCRRKRINSRYRKDYRRRKIRWILFSRHQRVEYERLWNQGYLQRTCTDRRDLQDIEDRIWIQTGICMDEWTYTSSFIMTKS